MLIGGIWSVSAYLEKVLSHASATLLLKLALECLFACRRIAACSVIDFSAYTVHQRRKEIGQRHWMDYILYIHWRQK